MNFEDQVKSNCGALHYERVKICQFSQLELQTISQGVLFVFAAWSGAAILSFRLLCEAVSRSPEASFPIIVIDADAYDFDAFRQGFGGLPQGKGEAFWIKGGKIVFRDDGYTHETKDSLETRVNSFT